MTERKTYITSVLAFLLLTALLFYLQRVNPGANDVNLIQRGIESNLKLWLNGYLGQYFNIKYLGVINWLILPLLILASIRFQYFKKNWVKAVLLAYALTTLLIAFKGYFNSRYQMSLLPLTISAVFGLIWMLLKEYNLSKYKYHSIILLLGFVLTSNFLGYLLLERLPNKILKEETNKFSIVDQLTDEIENFENKIKTFKNRIKTFERKKKRENYEVIKYVNKHLKNDVFLVNNLPIFYYNTELKGVYYWCGDDTYFGEKGQKYLLKNRSQHDAVGFLKDSLRCDYLLSTPHYNTYNQEFNDIVCQYFKPIYLDKNDYVIYKIEKTKGLYSLDPLKSALQVKLTDYLPPYFVSIEDVEP